MLTLQQQRQLLQLAASDGWRISPLATGIKLSQNSGRQFLPYRHLRILSDEIRRTVTTANGSVLIVSMPPQHGKSTMISEYTPTWFLENWPQNRVLLGTYNQTFADSWGYAVREKIEQNRGILNVEVASDSSARNFWRTNQGGSMLCAGVGTGFTGKAGELIIIDDPIKTWEEATSPTYLEMLRNFWVTNVMTRIHKNTAIIIVATRWSSEDLSGWLIKNKKEFGFEDKLRVLNLPAVYDDMAAKDGPDPLGRTSCGDALNGTDENCLCPEMHGMDHFRIQMRMNEEQWSALYQGRPGAQGGPITVYKGFSDTLNVREIDRDPRMTMIWSLDFNVGINCSVIGQRKEWYGQQSHLTNEKSHLVEIFDEICLPNSSTVEVVNEFIARSENWGSYQINLEIYGDESGGRRQTSQTSGSDYDIILEMLRHHSKFKVRLMLAGTKTNTVAVKERTNIANNAFHNTLNERWCYVDPRCKFLIKDLNEVRWKRDAAGNVTGQLDTSDAQRTHVSDALCYGLYRIFGPLTWSGESSGVVF